MERNSTPKQLEPANLSGAPELPELPRPRMPLSQRAKIFMPFDALKGFQAALREKEREVEESFDVSGGLEETP